MISENFILFGMEGVHGMTVCSHHCVCHINLWGHWLIRNSPIKITPFISNYKSFCFSKYITITMYIDIMYIYMCIAKSMYLHLQIGTETMLATGSKINGSSVYAQAELDLPNMLASKKGDLFFVLTSTSSWFFSHGTTF